MIDRVRAYIKNQEEHHKKKTFKQEYDQFIEKCGFSKFNHSFAEADALIWAKAPGID